MSAGTSHRLFRPQHYHSLGVSNLLRSSSFACLIGLVLCIGCGVKTETITDIPASPVPTSPVIDDPDSVAAIERIATNTRHENDAMIEVDFRGTEVTDNDLDALTGFSHLRSVILMGTAISDKGLQTLGKISTLQNLDLRECNISNNGLASLTSLSNLKALKLSGINGACSVDDDGMVHIANLKNLKVLGVDSLVVSEDGLKQLTGLSELSELYMGNTSIGDEAIELMTHFTKLKKLRVAGSHRRCCGIDQHQRDQYHGNSRNLVRLDRLRRRWCLF